MDLKDYTNKLIELQGKHEYLKEREHRLQNKMAENTNDQVHLEKALVIFQKVAQQTQEKLKLHITDIVQMALDSCFPDYTFAVDFEIKRGRTETRLYFIKDGCEIDPMNSSGGGAIDLTSFALRIVAWSLGKTRNTIILDEPFKHLSRDKQPLAGELLKELSEKLNLQFILSTHNQDMINIADRVFETTIITDDSGNLVTKVVVTDN